VFACDRDCRAERLLLSREVVPVVEGMPPYVPRPQIEAILAHAIGHTDQTYVALIGPRGVGKTRVVEAAVANQTGVVRLDLGGRLESREVVYRAIFQELGDKLADEFSDFGVGVVTRLFQRVKAQHRRLHPAAVDWVPTVIAEVRTGGDQHDVIYDIATAFKALNTDRRSCRVILVLSDADAAFGLPMDERRQTLVWIDDFTIDEAAQFLDNVGCLPLHRRIDSNGTDLNEQLRRRLFAFVGTRPSTLESIATMLADVPPASLDERVDKFIVAELAQADDVLRRLFAQSASPSGAEFRRLVETLLQSPELAVSPKQLSGDLAVPDVATKVLKRYHALLFHHPSRTYRFYSPTYVHAARNLIEEGV